ncbi:NAD-dependent epimerase/dehydratase family protein [Amycolatopsis vancoresmycina]|uniref:NAD-dependent epimerase/dehydratase n=1 Tax=Amycolatopsis vancoresmycina DSM 44592 TaxID=1292037 RepID=R1GA21_9PSEU|nr:NAD-dependent epimerase/dehydratase family protein [Amycolatopsis vancoresmycina]EOD68237.1 NAD-dependent epimerase/dehydratase [Amycolatopsis vancoresmycina DSM 44592]
MLVSITGGTGYVGAHSTAALVKAGHRVRLLVRDESTVESALAPLGVDPAAVDVVTGNVLDRFGVDRLLRGADALLHAASVYSFDSRSHRELSRTNVAGTEQVLEAARRAGTGRIVYVSSFGALLPSPGRPLTPRSPVGRPRERYLAAKAEAETVARTHQAAGVPVTITYPPALLGPHDPKLGDQVTRLRNTLRGLMPIWPTGGLPMGDIRDTASLHAALITGTGPAGNRHFAPGRYVSTREFVSTLREVTGRALPAVYLPARAMFPLGVLTGWVQRAWPWHIPAEYGAMYTCACDARVEESGRPSRELSETLADTIRWLHGKGLLAARAAGTVADGGLRAA